MRIERDPEVRREEVRGGLRIPVLSAVGAGHTTLSAYDAALYRCGACHYNLSMLTSVIPPGSEVAICDHYQAPPEEYGYRLHVIKAEARSAEPGSVVAAGVGWLQWGDGRGIFVEHEAVARNASCAEIEAALSDQIGLSLQDLAAIRGIPFDLSRINLSVVSTRVASQPMCALVIAVYESEGWCRSASTPKGAAR